MHSLWDNKANKIKEAESLKAREREHQKQIDTANAYARCFATDDGMKVIEHLSNEYIFNSTVNLTSINVNYEAAYKNGEAGLVKMIIAQITRAQNL